MRWLNGMDMQQTKNSRLNETMLRFTKICTRFPKAVITFLLLLTLSFAYFAGTVERDHSLERIIPPDEPIRVFYDEFREHFDIKSKIVIAVYHPDGIYTPAALEQVYRLTDKLNALDLIDRVQSLATIENIDAEDGMITIDVIAKAVPKTGEEIRTFTETARANPMIANGLVSGDEMSTILLVQPAFEIDETHNAVVVSKKIDAIVNADPGPGKIYVTGFPTVIGMSNRHMDRDNKVMLPLVGLLLLVLLWFSFRSVRGVWIPFSVVVASVVWTYGVIGLADMKTTIICASIPIVLVSMGIADGIHVLHEYYHHLRKGADNLTAIHNTMLEMNAPVVMTSLTTMVGFMALATSKIVPIREYGLAVALGVLWAMCFSLSFIPAVLTLLGKPKKILSAKVANQGILERLSIALGRYSLSHSKQIAVTFFLALLATGALSPFLKVRNNPVMYFRDGSDLRISDAFLNEHFAGTGELQVQIDGKKEGALKDPELLEKIARFQVMLEELPEVGNTTSVIDFLRRMNVVLNENNEAFDRVPGTKEDMGDSWTPEAGRAKIAQYYLLYESTGGEELSSAVDFMYQRAHIHVNAKSNDSRQYRIIMNRIEEVQEELFPSDKYVVGITGAGAINLKVVEYLVLGQVMSLLLSAAVVFLMLMFLFKSVVDAMIGAIPLIITVTTNFAVMVLVDIPLNMGTALIASVVIGVGVDYSIHFIHRYRLECKRSDDINAAVDTTMDTSGRAIMFNAMSVGGGFAILLASSFMPLVYLGILMPLVMFVNALAALLVIPAFLNLLRKRTSVPA
jgi:uncharacterized protein